MVQKFKKELRTTKGKMILFLAISSLALGAWVSLESRADVSSLDSKPEIEEIVLEIRDMMFGDNNPTILIRPGQTVRITVTNLDPGMKHDFQIPATNISTRVLEYGEKDFVLVNFPTSNEFSYQCSLHALMMWGRLIVSDELALQGKYILPQ